MNKALSKAVVVAVVLAYPPGSQAQSTQSVATYPLPVEVGNGEFIASGVYLKMNFTRMNEPVTAILSETFERETPRRALADILRAVRDDDFDVFTARLDHEDGTDAQEVFDYLKAWITDWNDVVHNRTLEVAGLTYFILDGDGLRVLAIPIPIIQRHGKSVMSWQLVGHNVVHPVNVFLRAIEDSPNA